ncbi:MAG: diguanylate cyclase domain-containing protein [Burkholderiales bacterium]
MKPASSAALTPRPDNEAARLRAVQDLCILDTGPEPEFEAIARVAARLFGTPMAMVSIMDDKRLWLKAQIGLNITELPRQDALCALTLAQPVAHHQPLVIQDLWQDPRAVHNPFVTGPSQWRFYAAAPLFDALGHGLGTVAVMDTEPRSFNMAQRHALSDLALLAVKALEGRAHGLKLAQTEHRDPLTGLSSRSQFDLALDIELRHAMRTGEPFTVLCIAVDGLQTVVDGFGADAKEQVLRQLSNQLAPQVRMGDVLARLHDDEFAVVMRHGDQSSAEMLVSRMVAAAKTPINLHSGDTVGVGLSVGIAAYNDGVENAAALLSQAHQALHHAKQKNEERWSFFRPLKEKPDLRLIQKA